MAGIERSGWRSKETLGISNSPTGWWFQTCFIYFPYMGCHPSHWLPYGYLTVRHGKSPFLMGKPSISMGHGFHGELLVITRLGNSQIFRDGHIAPPTVDHLRENDSVGRAAATAAILFRFHGLMSTSSLQLKMLKSLKNTSDWFKNHHDPPYPPYSILLVWNFTKELWFHSHSTYRSIHPAAFRDDMTIPGGGITNFPRNCHQTWLRMGKKR